MDPLFLLLSIHPNYWTRKGHHHQQYGQILSSPPIEWPAVILGRNSRDSITHRKTRYQLQITVLRVLGHTPPGHRDPLSFLCLREKTSTVHRVVMCVGDKGTVCRHLWILRVLHAAPNDMIVRPSSSCSAWTPGIHVAGHSIREGEQPGNFGSSASSKEA